MYIIYTSYVYYQSEGYPNGIFGPCACCSLDTCQDGWVVGASSSTAASFWKVKTCILKKNSDLSKIRRSAHYVCSTEKSIFYKGNLKNGKSTSGSFLCTQISFSWPKSEFWVEDMKWSHGPYEHFGNRVLPCTWTKSSKFSKLWKFRISKI